MLILILCSPAASLDEPPIARGWSWRFITGGVTVGPVAFASDGVAYFATGDRYLYAVDSRGTMLWRTDLDVRPAGGLVVGTDGTIFVTLESGELIALNRDGRLIWRRQVTADRPLAPVVTANGIVITVRRPGTIEARTHTGRFVWGLETGVQVSAAPVLVRDGNVLVSGEGGEYILISVDGRLIRRRYLGEVATVLGVTDREIVAGSADGRVIAFDATLEPVWRADVGSAVHTLVVGSTGDAYVISDDGMLSRITSEGVLAWRTQLDSGRAVALVAAEDLFLVTGGGALERRSRESDVIWQTPLLDRPVSVSAAPSGELIIPTASWVTYAYPVSVVASGPWPEARGGADRRGVAPGAAEGRPDMAAYGRTVDYLALQALLIAGGPTEQNAAMGDVAARIHDGHNLAGRYPYLLHLSELVAGSPYFGQLSQFGPRSAPRRAREEAIVVLGEIGDLATSRFLARLLSHEADPSLQATILRSMGTLGTPIDRELATRLSDIVRRNLRTGPDDTLGHAVSAFIESVHVHRGGYLHPEVADSLLTIAQGAYSRQVREYALATLRVLAGGGR